MQALGIEMLTAGKVKWFPKRARKNRKYQRMDIWLLTNEFLYLQYTVLKV